LKLIRVCIFNQVCFRMFQINFLVTEFYI
jgi:hypothetical protein